jgi:hypothetical protein
MLHGINPVFFVIVIVLDSEPPERAMVRVFEPGLPHESNVIVFVAVVTITPLDNVWVAELSPGRLIVAVALLFSSVYEPLPTLMPQVWGATSLIAFNWTNLRLVFRISASELRLQVRVEGDFDTATAVRTPRTTNTAITSTMVKPLSLL